MHITLLPKTGNEKLTIKKNPTRTMVNKTSFAWNEFKIFPFASAPNIKYKKIEGKIVMKHVIRKHDITTFLLFLYSGEYGCNIVMTTVGNANVKAYTPTDEKREISNLAKTIVFEMLWVGKYWTDLTITAIM